jgi:hypothetical protein
LKQSIPLFLSLSLSLRFLLTPEQTSSYLLRTCYEVASVVVVADVAVAVAVAVAVGCIGRSILGRQRV